MVKICFGNKRLRALFLGAWWLVIGTGSNTGISAAADSLDGVYLTQQAAGSPSTRPPASEDAMPPSQEKARKEKSKEQTPAAPAKRAPLKPFEPTEKVKADQAVDFPADI